MTKLKELTIKLPENWVEHLEYLETITGKKKDYYILQSLYRYLEDFEDYEIAMNIKKKNNPTYSGEKATEILKQLRADRKAKQNL